MEFENIITLIKAVSDSHLTQFSLEEDGCKISMKTDKAAKVVTAVADGAVYTMNGAPAANSVSVNVADAEDKKPAGNIVKSPLVGTFYHSQSPDAEPFAKIGDVVKKGQTLAIVEAMKLMNEIECEFDGILKEILVKNEQMVEYGQPLFIIE